MRYIIAFCIFILVFVVSFFGMGGQSLMNLVDVSGILLVIIFPFLFVCIFNGFSGVKNAFLIYKNISASKEVLMKALLVLKMYSKITWLSCIIAVVFSVLSYLGNIENSSYLYISIAVASDSILYAALINIFMLPFEIKIKKRMNENEK